MEKELNFENKEVDFNFNKKESPHKSDKKIKIQFDLQYILDYLHKKEVIVFEGDAQKEIGDLYGIDIITDKYYYVPSSNQPTVNIPVLTVFQSLLYQELEK